MFIDEDEELYEALMESYGDPEVAMQKFFLMTGRGSPTQTVGVDWHPNWNNHPENTQVLNNYLDLRSSGNVQLTEQIAKIMSHMVYGEDDFDLSYIDEAYRKPLKNLLPTLAEEPGGIYDMAAIAAKYVMINRNEKKPKTPEQAAEEFKEMVDEAQKAKSKKEAKGNRGGPHGGRLWSGPPYRQFFTDKSAGSWPQLQNMDIVKNGAKSANTRKAGKPKVTYLRRMARSVNELKFCRAATLALPDDLFWMKYTQGQLEVFIPQKEIIQKQVKIVFLDDSSSMHDELKIKWLQRIFNTLFEEILNGNSIMYFAPFTHWRNPLWKIETAEDVEDLKLAFRIGTGGGTEIGSILQEVIPKIQAGEIDGFPVHNRTEILIINDGQDRITPLTSPIPIHSISVEEVNTDLKQLCNDSGGQYFVAAGGNLQLL